MWNCIERLVRDLNILFRTGLIITGSTESAERAIVEAIGALGELEPPQDESTHDLMAFAVARNSVAALRMIQPASDCAAESLMTLLPKELHLVLELPTDLRCCFVLRTLEGYSNEQVGILMNMQGGEVEMLAQNALSRFADLAREHEQRAVPACSAAGSKETLADGSSFGIEGHCASDPDDALCI